MPMQKRSWQRVDGVLLLDKAAGMSSNQALQKARRLYSAAKAGISNFTKWLATYMAQNHSTKIRVNEIRPGFFPTLQNADLIKKTPGAISASRGTDILGKTPMKRFGQPEELVGAIAYLCSPAATFTTGSSIAVDGGFGSFSGV